MEINFKKLDPKINKARRKSWLEKSTLEIN